MDVGAWLRGLGSGQHEQAFRDNEIDAEVLPRLTADDLKDLGVTLAGQRRKLLDAIEALRDNDEVAPLRSVRAGTAIRTGTGNDLWLAMADALKARVMAENGGGDAAWSAGRGWAHA